MYKDTILIKTKHTVAILLLCLIFVSCKKVLDIAPPSNSTTAGNVYSSDFSAASAVTGIYTQISQLNYQSVYLNVQTGLSSDELVAYIQSDEYVPFYQNSLSANMASNGAAWTNSYPLIYLCNAAIEGLSNSSSLSEVVKRQLLGEVLFLRGYLYFCLTNLYGDVPLALTTDYKINSGLARSSTGDVYAQIINDLITGKALLSSNYVNSSASGSSSERIRVNKSCASALLARVYLYQKKYSDSEREASELISNKTVYDTVAVESTFKKNSKETIWAIQPISSYNTEDARLFYFPSTGPTSSTVVVLNDRLFSVFETNDKRKKYWIGTGSTNGVDYHFAYKYRVSESNQGLSEYLVCLRLAEQYLIRAESRAYQNNLSGSREDLNVIRKRAGLINSLENTQVGLVEAILLERQKELFTEGHRWFDLKRSSKVNEVMSVVTPLKGGTWKSDWQLYPVPNSDRLLNRNLSQNQGYEN